MIEGDPEREGTFLKEWAMKQASKVEAQKTKEGQIRGNEGEPSQDTDGRLVLRAIARASYIYRVCIDVCVVASVLSRRNDHIQIRNHHSLALSALISSAISAGALEVPGRRQRSDHAHLDRH